MIGGLVLTWAIGVLVVSAVACARAFAARRRSPAPARVAEPVLLIRPCAGDEPWLEQALRSTAALQGRPARIRFTVADTDDPAAPVAARVAATLAAQGWDARLVVSPTARANRKAGQIATLLAGEPHAGPVVIADADVDLSGFPLDRLCAPLADPKVGAAWASPAENAPPHTAADRASSALLGASLHAFPLLGALDAGGLVGKLCAFRPAAAGDLEALADYLGEDMALGAALRARGFRIVATPLLARSLVQGRDAASVLARYTRWLLVIRGQRPALLASYPLLIAATPALLLAAALLAPWQPATAACTAAIALASRTLVARSAARLTERRASGLAVDALRADLLLWRAWFAALRTRRVVWRGRTLRLTRSGALAEV